MKVLITASLWSLAVGTLHDRPHDRERVVFLDGPRGTGDIGVVSTVVLPEVDHSRGNYAISPESMSRAGRHLRAHGLMRLAQMHSHPGAWTGHSRHDDEMAFTSRPGALSIVVPHFGSCAPGLGDCGVHVRDEEGWRGLESHEVPGHLRLVPTILDFRP